MIIMKIASWNVNSIRSRLDHVTAWLKARKPDVLLLQELNGTEFPSTVFEDLVSRLANVFTNSWRYADPFCTSGVPDGVAPKAAIVKRPQIRDTRL